jgi:hypothetical protein
MGASGVPFLAAAGHAHRDLLWANREDDVCASDLKRGAPIKSRELSFEDVA